jgi:hypothetical protein
VSGGLLRAGLAAAAIVASAGPAAAERASEYTKLDGSNCSAWRTTAEASGERRCRGFGGIAVLIVSGDDRAAVSYGPKAAEEPAASVFFGPLNSAGDTVEWRGERAASGFRPDATIVRWSAADEEQGRQRRTILVVTRLRPGPVCHVAYIEGSLPNANALAREAADRLPNECPAEPPIMGPPGPGTRVLLGR